MAIQTIYRAFSDENGIVKVADLEAPAPVEPGPGRPPQVAAIPADFGICPQNLPWGVSFRFRFDGAGFMPVPFLYKLGKNI